MRSILNNLVGTQKYDWYDWPKLDHIAVPKNRLKEDVEYTKEF